MATSGRPKIAGPFLEARGVTCTFATLVSWCPTFKNETRKIGATRICGTNQFEIAQMPNVMTSIYAGICLAIVMVIVITTSQTFSTHFSKTLF